MSADFPRFRLFLIVCITMLALSGFRPEACGAQATEKERNHGPVFAGTWYPGNSEELRADVSRYLQKAPSGAVDEKVFALLSPHAGFIYSGQVAAYSYKLLQGRKFDTVIVIGPSHQFPFTGAAVFDCAGFRTPLGVMPVDNHLIADLLKREPRIKNIPQAFEKEHSLEIQIPFIQTTLPAARLVPIVMGTHDLSTCRRLADAIAGSIRGKSVLIVASSDLSHFHSYADAVEMDRRLLDKLGAMDVQSLDDCLNSRKCEACGSGPILTAMLAAKQLGANDCRILHYANSGDVTGEKNSPRGVVGYAAAAFFKTPRDRDSAEAKIIKDAGADSGLTEQERAELHTLARKTIEAKCGGAPMPAVRTSSAKLKEPRAAFVTLYKQGELRGCIGHIIARKPLVETVAEMAEAAALHDPRFRPVRSDELGDIKIEISVLTPLKKISSPEEVVVGKHGLVISRGGASGLLLPQVATEQGWDRTSFLEYTCVKAGLPRDSWKDIGTEIYIFSAEVF
ncbi:MAG: AmmeMemoRadiSam system protein B [Syntrophobacteraceae bacterium]